MDGLGGSLEVHCNDNDPESFAILRFRHPSRRWQFTTPVHFCHVQCDSKTNLPQQTAFMSSDNTMLHKAIMSSIMTTGELNKNLDIHQKSLLQLHFKFGHIGMKHIQHLVRNGKVNCRNVNQVADCGIPKCVACLFGKMTRKPTEATHTQRRKDNQGNLKKGHLKPGQCISADQCVCAEPGQLCDS